MAKRVTIEIIDDTNGSPAEQTVPFGLDGVAYEIDLSTTNANALREALAPYVAAGGSRSPSASPPTAQNRNRSQGRTTQRLTTSARGLEKTGTK
jgi:hypothetical protein